MADFYTSIPSVGELLTHLLSLAIITVVTAWGARLVIYARRAIAELGRILSRLTQIADKFDEFDQLRKEVEDHKAATQLVDADHDRRLADHDAKLAEHSVMLDAHEKRLLELRALEAEGN